MNAFLVVAVSTALTTMDTAVKTRLEGLGWTITLVDDDAAAPSTAGYGLCVFAESCLTASLGTKYNHYGIPLVILDTSPVVNFDMSSNSGGNATAATAVTVLDATAPMANGKTGTVTVLASGCIGYMAAPFGAGVDLVLSLSGNSAQVCGFTYEAGAALLNSHTAEARRAQLGLFVDINPSPNADGWGFFDATINWAAPAVTTPAWTTPADTVSMSTTPDLKFTSPASAAKQHFQLQLDTANTFNTGNLRTYDSSVTQTNWTYYNGSSWVAIPPDGLPIAYAGNEVDYTVTSALSSATWYRRVRAGTLI
jgi:hypothetical protein